MSVPPGCAPLLIEGDLGRKMVVRTMVTERRSPDAHGDPFPMEEPRAKLMWLAGSRRCVHESRRWGLPPVTWLCCERRQGRMRVFAR